MQTTRCRWKIWREKNQESEKKVLTSNKISNKIINKICSLVKEIIRVMNWRHQNQGDTEV